MIRIATFNMENLFARASGMAEGSGTKGQQALADFGELTNIVAKETYSDADKARLIELSQRYKFHDLNQNNPFITMNKVRGRLFYQPQGTNDLQVVANGREDWVGWFDLIKKDISWAATRNTARVISDVKPDILLCVEIESRPALQRFNDQVLKAEFGINYDHVMLVDGNDERGIDLGVMSRFPIRAVRNHLHEPDPAIPSSYLFSRDCPEYEIELPNGETLILIGGHFKSKRGGNDPAGAARRGRQAARTAAIYREARQRTPYVVVAGDFNDSPDQPPLQPLINMAGDPNQLQDVMSHPTYQGRPGTFGTGTATNKLDYILLPAELWALVDKVDVERRGLYHPNTWAPYDTVESERSQASDHATPWVDIDLPGIAPFA